MTAKEYNGYMTENTPTPPKPIKVINDNIPPLNVAKYYLEVELFKLFKNSTDVMADTICETVQNLSESKIWALLEAISFTYHLNGVFYNISRDNYVWKEEAWNVKNLILTGMDSKTNKVIFSKEVNGDTLKFKNHLLNYFKITGEDDPEGLLSYRPSKKVIVFKKLIMKEQEGKIQMLDGSHRLIEMVLAGIEEVTAYVGHPSSKEAEEKPISRMGNSTFILLTIMFKKGSQEERAAVVTLLKQLIRNSVDGRAAVQKYWIDVQRDEEIKEAGIGILSES